MLDALTGDQVGPVIAGTNDRLDTSRQIAAVRPGAAHAHVHTHPANSAFSDLDAAFLIAWPDIRVIVVAALDGYWYVISKLEGVAGWIDVVLVYQLSGQGLAVAALVAAEIAPVLLLGPVAGVVIDRLNCKHVLIAADLFRAALVASLIWPQGLGHIYLVAAGLVAGNTFFGPTVQAIIPVLTSEDERLAANSVNWSTGRVVQVVGAAVAGGLVGVMGTAPAFAINAATFLASAALIARLRIPPRSGHLAGETTRGLAGYFGDARRGLAYAASDVFVSRLLVVQAVASLATGATSAMQVVLAEVHLRLPTAGFAALIGVIGVGSLLGPLIPNLLVRDYRDPRWLFIPYVVRGVGDVALAIFIPLPVALGLLFVYGLSASAGMVTFSSAVQSAVPEDVRGRVFTLLDVVWQAMRLLSLLAGGLMVDRVGVQPIYWIGGALLIVPGVLGLVLLRGVRVSTSSEAVQYLTERP